MADVSSQNSVRLVMLCCGREHEITRLIRVDVSSNANGVLAVALSEQERGFAPYRLDNCTGLRLHLRCAPALYSLLCCS